MIRIRKARPNDIAGIADIVEDVWEQSILPDVCKAQIQDDGSELWVATDKAGGEHAHQVVAFASAFLTVGPNACRRWEIDLVAVRPERQGQGLGTELVGRICKASKGKGASLSRALIRGENIASQRAFENVGFTTDGRVQHLLLWRPRPGAVSLRHLDGVILLPVDTVTYRGLWIEGLENVSASEQQSVVRAARAIIARDGRLNTGALIPADREHRLAIDLRNGARMHGEYTWYVKPGITNDK